MSLRTIIVTVIAIWLWILEGMKPLTLLCIYFFWVMLLVDDKGKADRKREGDEKFRKWKDDFDREFKKGKYAVTAVTKADTGNQGIKKKEEQLKTLKDLSRKEGYEYLSTAVSQMEQEIEAEKDN